MDDVEVLTGLARRVERFAGELYAPVGVRKRAGLLRQRGRRQDHIGKRRGFGQEQILHNQVVKLGQSLPRVMQVGVGHGRVLAHDVHTVQPVVENGVHDLDHGQTGLRVQGDTPEGLEALPYLLVVDPLVVGEHHGNQAGVRGSLNIVLAAQRMESGPRATDLSGHQSKRNETARIVGAVDML